MSDEQTANKAHFDKPIFSGLILNKLKIKKIEAPRHIISNKTPILYRRISVSETLKNSPRPPLTNLHAIVKKCVS